MSTLTQLPPDLAARAQKFYQEKLKPRLEPAQHGKFVALEPDSESYFLGSNDLEALAAARAAWPDKFFYLMRIGFRAAHKVGGGLHGARKGARQRLR